MPSAMSTPSLQLQIDELILDYLLWHCIETLLEEHRQLRTNPEFSSRPGDLAIKLARTFYGTFTNKHPSHTLSEPVLMRLRDCTFTTAFFRRTHLTSPDSSAAISQHSRSENWIEQHGDPIIPAEFMPVYRARASSRTTAAHQQVPPPLGAYYGELTLRDTLWEFMMLSAHMAARHEDVTPGWIELAVEFMTHACVEGFLTDNSTAVEAINQAFSYGLNYASDPLMQSIEDIILNELFVDESEENAREFEIQKRTALDEFSPRADKSLDDVFVEVKRKHKWAEFEQVLVDHFLAHVSDSQSRPALAQLEQGKLEGFREEDVRAVLASAGVSEEVWRP